MSVQVQVFMLSKVSNNLFPVIFWLNIFSSSNKSLISKMFKELRGERSCSN